MREAARITVAAHKRAMRFTAPGHYEYQVAAEIHHEFAFNGASAPLMAPFVAVARMLVFCITRKTSRSCVMAIYC